MGRADEPQEILVAPALGEPIALSTVDHESAFEPVGEALQAQISVDATLSVDLSLFGWASYDWSEQTITFDGFIGEDAAGEQAIIVEGEWGATYRFTNGDNPPTTWTHFDTPAIGFQQDWRTAVGGVFLPGTPENTPVIDVGVSGSYLGTAFEVEGGSPASGLQGLSYSLWIEGTWTGDLIEVALEPGGPPVAVVDGYQQLVDLRLENPGPDATVSVFATHRGTLTITRADGQLRPSIDLEAPYVDELGIQIDFDFPLVLNMEIALPETEIVIPGVELPGSGTDSGEGTGTDTDSDSGGGADESTGATTDADSSTSGTTGAPPDVSTGSETGFGEGATGSDTGAPEAPDSGSSGGCACSTSDRGSIPIAYGSFSLLCVVAVRRRQ